MNAIAPCRNPVSASLALASVLFLVSMKCHAFAYHVQEQQQQSQSEQSPPPLQNPQASSQQIPVPEQPAPRKRKVWTNDDMASLRSPADTYLAEKESQEAASAEAAAKKEALAKQIKEAGLTLNLPATSEETRRLIQAKQNQIRDLQDGTDRLIKDLLDAPPERKLEIQKEIETFKGYLEKAGLELKVLLDHLQSLAKTAPNESPSSFAPPATPPSQENPF
jgi:transcriptional regulator of NAD metabolism